MVALMINVEQSALPPPRDRRYRARCLVALAAAVALSFGATACGSSSSGTKGSNAGGTTTTSTLPGKTTEVSPAGDIPDNQAYVTYAPPGQGYSVKVPEGWARSARGGATVFTDKLNSIRMERVNTPTAPTVGTVTTGEVPNLVKSEKHFRAGKVRAVRRSAGSAVLVTYEADGAPDAVTTKVRRMAVERYEFWRNGQSVILTLSGAKGADNVDPWKIVTSSFRWKP